MSLNMRLGKRGNLLQPGPGSYRQLLLETPILRESELEAIQTSSGLSSKVRRQQTCCPASNVMSGPAFRCGPVEEAQPEHSPRGLHAMRPEGGLCCGHRPLSGLPALPLLFVRTLYAARPCPH